MTETILPDVACIRQRLFRVVFASVALEGKIIDVLSRLTVLQAPVSHADVAEVTDRLHEVFNAYSFLTRCNGWHGLDDDDEE